MSAPTIKGIPFVVGGKTLILPPLSLGFLETNQDRIEAFQRGDPKAITTVIDCVHAALRRNYPDVARADVGEAIGLEGISDVMTMVMDVSGVVRRKKEDEAAGEAAALSPGAASTPG